MDSTLKITRCMQKAAEDVGLAPLDDRVVANIIGLGLPEAIRRLYPEVDAPQAEAVRQRYAEHFVHLDDTPMAFFSGVLEGLESLRSAGIALAVATGKSRKGLDRILKDFDLTHYFDWTRCADETCSKPDPRMLREILQAAGVAPHQAVMIGDTEYDLAMAQALAVPALAVTYGAHAQDRLERFNPHLCTDDFAVVSSWLLNHFQP